MKRLHLLLIMTLCIVPQYTFSQTANSAQKVITFDKLQKTISISAQTTQTIVIDTANYNKTIQVEMYRGQSWRDIFVKMNVNQYKKDIVVYLISEKTGNVFIIEENTNNTSLNLEADSTEILDESQELKIVVKYQGKKYYVYLRPKFK